MGESEAGSAVQLDPALREQGEHLFTLPGEAILRRAPFLSEEDYWSLVKARTRARADLSLLKLSMRRTALGLYNEAGFREGLPELARNEAVLTQRYETVEAAYWERMALTPSTFPAPRLTRLAHRIHLNNAEVDALHLIIMNVCQLGFEEMVLRRDLNQPWCYVDMTPQEFMRFQDDHGPLIRLGLVQKVGSNPPNMQMQTTAAKALMGLALRTDELFLMSEGVIGDVLREEPGVTDIIGLAGGPAASLLQKDGTSLYQEKNPKEDGDDASAGKYVQDGIALRDEALRPYTSDLEYLSDHIDWLRQRLVWKKGRSRDPVDTMFMSQDAMTGGHLAEEMAREKILKGRIQKRLALTRAAGTWMPRVEELADSRCLSQEEKHLIITLAGLASSKDLNREFNHFAPASIGDLIYYLFDSFEDQVGARKMFQRESPLIRDGLIVLEEHTYDSNILRAEVGLDRRMLEYLLRLDSGVSECVANSHLYEPRCQFDRVVIPERDRDLILKTVASFPAFLEERKRCGFDEMAMHAGGIILMFYGPSGTGKTLMANALAAHMGKKILLVNFPRLGDEKAGSIVRYIFREAKLNGAIIFFDECEMLFENREHNKGISMLLTEVERFDGLVIMATNRPYEMDEAMHRRITLAVEFTPPDVSARDHIWRTHIPPGLRLEASVDFSGLAYRHELTGGLIKNAVLAAISMAVARDPAIPVVRQEDLEMGARLQMRSRLSMREFSDRIVPKTGLESLVLQASKRKVLEDIIGLEKARRTLVTDWGFDPEDGHAVGTSALFWGQPGTGKSHAARSLAFELGRPVKQVNMAQLATKWVGDGAKNLEALFKEARENDAALVFDEADALFAGRTSVRSSTDRYANLDVAVLLREMERFPGVVILTTNLADNIDAAFRRRIRFHVEFPLPDAESRLKLWGLHTPKELPLAEGVNFEALAKALALTGAQIKNAILKAASRAALRSPTERRVCQSDLWAACEEETGGVGTQKTVGFAGAV